MREADTAPLTADRWQRIAAIFHAALELPESDRVPFLERTCAGDDALIGEVLDLLSAFDDAKSFRPPAETPEFGGRRGEIIGGYRLEAELGHGGMGTVYLANRADGQFEQQVALKVVSPHLRTRFFAERFRSERQILATLSHPNITRLLDGGVSGSGDPYLVMEYVDGQPIDRYCDQRLLTVADRVRLFVQVCSAVEYAHRKLVVHRDLKPANVLMTSDGLPKLLDFGTARLLAADGVEATTRLHAMTMRYASPEQLRGEPVSTSMDVYSLGVTLYELVVGAWPFGNPESPMAGLERALREVAPAPPQSLVTEESARLRSTSQAKLASLLHGDLRSVMLKAIESDARRRYSSVEQFSEDLRRWLTGQPVLAREQTLLYRGARFAKRHRWRLAAAAVVAAALCVSILVAVRQYGREQRRIVQVRNLSQSYLGDILSEVGKLPGSMKARLLIVDRARRNLDQLLPEAPNDPELRRVLEAAYLQLGDIQGKPFTVSLGDTAGALESYGKAEKMAALASDRDWESLAALVRARRTIAQIEARAGEESEAVAELNSALEPATRLWRNAPPGLRVDGQSAAALYVETNLTLGYTMLKAVERTPGDVPQLQRVLAQLRRTVGIAEQIHAAHPSQRGNQYMGFVLEYLGNATGDSGYFTEAVAAHRRTTDSACGAFAKDPGPQTQRDCGDALGELSWALHWTGDGEQAIQEALQALSLIAPVSKAEPDSVEAQQDLAYAYMHLGAAENTAGRYVQAIGPLRTAEARMQALRQTSAGDPLEARGLEADIERELGDALLGTNQPGAAAQALGKALAAAQRSPKSAYWITYIQRQLAKARSLRMASTHQK